MSKWRLYFEYFLEYFKDKLFGKKKQTKQLDYEETRFEKWIISEKDHRFENEETSDYKTFVHAGKISITAKRKSVYAWSVNKFFRYEDFSFDFTVVFDKKGVSFKTDRAGTCAGGLLFRYINARVFYALLVSDQGWLRMDVMINGSPITVLGWTKPTFAELSENNPEMNIKLVAINNKFHILANDIWVATLQNDVIQSAGKIALAVQNWETFSKCTVQFKNLILDSKITSVENLDTEITQKSDNSYDAHINLASTFYAMERFDLASAEINKAENIRPLEVKDAMIAGRIYFAQKKFKDAERVFQVVILNQTDKNIKHQVTEELAGLYYKIGDFDALHSFLKQQKLENENLFNCSDILQNFSGHYFHKIGDHKLAGEYYKKAFELNENEGLFAFNCALEFEAIDDKDETYEWLCKSGYAFLNVENYTSLAEVVNKLESKYPDDEKTLSLLGKFYFGIENYPQSLFYLQKLCEEKNTKDASNWYLYALLIKNTDSKKYLEYLKKACKLDDTVALYFYRLAEAQFFSGLDCTFALEKSLNLDKNNAWSYNLKTLIALKNNDLSNALENILIARKILPDEIDLLTNYVEVKRLEGKLQEVIPLFDLDSTELDLAVERNRGKAAHILANAFYNDEKFDEASEWYEKAHKLIGDNYELLLNYAQNNMELGYLNAADELLVKALNMKKTVEIYRLIARLSTLKGNYLRAVACIDEGLQNFQNDTNLLYDLVVINLQFSKFDKASTILNKLSKIENSPRVKDLKSRIKSLQ